MLVKRTVTRRIDKGYQSRAVTTQIDIVYQSRSVTTQTDKVYQSRTLSTQIDKVYQSRTVTTQIDKVYLSRTPSGRIDKVYQSRTLTGRIDKVYLSRTPSGRIDKVGDDNIQRRLKRLMARQRMFRCADKAWIQSRFPLSRPLLVSNLYLNASFVAEPFFTGKSGQTPIYIILKHYAKIREFGSTQISVNLYL